MAELTAMRNNVLGYPIYALPYVLAFPILDEDGDPVTGLTPDSEISKNGDTAIDTATEAAEIAFDTATNKGMYQLQLSAAEMTADVVAITVYTGATTAQATAMVLYPKKLPKIIAGASVGATGNDTTHIHLPAGVAINDFYNGCVVYILTGTGALQARMISDYVASTKLATVSPAFTTAPAQNDTYDIYMTDVAMAPIISLLTGLIPNAVAGAANGLSIVGSVMGKSPATLAAADVSGNLPADVVNWKGSAAPAMTGDAYSRIGAAGAGLTALGDARIANLDAAVSTRSTLTAQQVWEYATRTLSSFGTLVADIWASGTRTLTAGTKDAEIAAIKAKTDNLPAAPAIEGNVQGHVAVALAAYDPPTKAELDALVSPLALEAGIEAHVLAVLNAYDPPTRAEATADKAAILTAVTALNDITVGELLAGDLSDSLSFPANSLADVIRKVFWVLCNRLAIVDATGAFTAYKGDGVTPGATGTITDNGTNTIRSAPTWP
jgi:hypothetical protein